ncbi:MAG TPA: hypothetical protein VD902_07440 [Symbiobacteriaceae bacterium]|nr:hypothetical protein [Symbiobacteriaceae bacterium]
MDRARTLHRLKFLWDQVHQTAERLEHLPSARPLHVHAESLNYPEDMSRFKREYNWLVQSALYDKTLTESDLQAAGLPPRFDWH